LRCPVLGFGRGTKPGDSRIVNRTFVALLNRLFRTGGILSYHGVVEEETPSPEMHVSVATLQAQLAHLYDRYAVIPLRELLHRRAQGRSTNGCVAITFDDAYSGVAQLAAPILSRFDIPATIFVTVDAAANFAGRCYWWDQLEVMRQCQTDAAWTVMLRRLGVPPLPQDRGSLALLRNAILVRRAGRFDLRRIGVDDEPVVPELLHSMDFATLRLIARDARFDFGSHTLSHPALPFLTPQEQERELREADERLRDELPRVLPIVAYPFGLYDEMTIAAARRSGVQAGLTMQGRALSNHDHVLALPRIGVSEDWSPHAISLRISSAMSPVLIARSGGRHPRLPRDVFAVTS
jgi:peptidoglycan/xylan/chitin deacetylase (PgdA/CDA1 family)